jgi:hypothetical protein
MKFLIIFLLITFVWSYELTIIQGISKSGQTFITRNGKEQGIFEGKKATFTSDDVSIIAKAISVTREFTQWEVQSDYTQVPFRKGEIVTLYDTTEYLWALSPSEVKAKFIQTKIFTPRNSYAFYTSFVRGLSESVSGVDTTSDSRGGIIFEGQVERELSKTFSTAAGIRYTSETINVSEASFTSTRFMGIAELRYYFSKMTSFFDGQVGLALGTGYGQSSTEGDGLTSSGTAYILPISKVMLLFPTGEKSKFVFDAAFESLDITETTADGTKQITKVTNLKTGIGFRTYF